MATSPDGGLLYIADRLGDSLLVFDAKSLVSGHASAPIAKVVIEEGSRLAAAAAVWSNWPGPSDVEMIDEGRRVVVKGLRNLTVIDAEGVVKGAEAILGTIPAAAGSAEWRSFAVVTADGKTLIVEVESGLAIIDLERLPLEPARK
jgi:hypothetical protein